MLAQGAPLSLEQSGRIRSLIDQIAAGRGESRLSEHSFPNLFLFRDAHSYRLLDGPIPAIEGRTYDDVCHLMPLCRLDDGTAQALLGEARECCLFPIAQWQLAALDPDRFEWSEREDDADYLYPARQFIAYRGARLQKKGNLMRQFQASHALAVEAIGPDQVEVAEDVLAGWFEDKGRARGEADDLPCREALRHAARLGLRGHLFRADGEAAGFLLTEEIEPGVFVLRFAKGRERFKGLYPTMFHHFVARIEPGARWLNFEQDLGLPNFRRTKRSFDPAMRLRKFRVRLRPSGAT